MKPDLVSMLDNAAWPALVVDGASVVRKANQAAIRLFGPALEGSTPKLSTIWSAENTQPPEQFLAEWERTPSVVQSLKLRTRGGVNTSFPTAFCCGTFEDHRYYLLQFLPQAPAAQANKAAVADSPQALKQKLECALQLARTVALDFNNALTSILAHSSHVLSQMENGHAWRESLTEIEKSATRAAEIAGDLGTFSRQEKEGRAQAHGNLNALLHRVVDGFRAGPGGESVSWSLQLERGLYAVRFDEPKMHQAFVKILENAVQALSEGGCVSIVSRNADVAEPMEDGSAKLAAGSYVCAEVSDGGCGIAPEVLPRIFEPFFTTKQGGHRGLGLAWVYGIVTNHGGGVAVSSQLGKGTTVRVYLPAEKRIVQDEGAGSADLHGTQTLLVVDDEDLLLTMGRTILGAYGYRVLTASTGQRALEILRQPDSKVDLVITDMVMPGMSGRELVERIHRQAPAMPILRTSGYVWGTPIQEDEAYLQKPFTAQDLLTKVKRLLERAAAVKR